MCVFTFNSHEIWFRRSYLPIADANMLACCHSELQEGCQTLTYCHLLSRTSLPELYADKVH